MPILFLLLSFFFSKFVLASSPALFSEDEDPSLFHHVNVLSGHLQLSMLDAQVAGPVPLNIQRSYSSTGALERGPGKIDRHLRRIRGGFLIQGGWSFMAGSHLLVQLGAKKSDVKDHLKVYVSDHGGGTLTYERCSMEGHVLVMKPSLDFVPSYGLISARTNPHNGYLKLDLKASLATLYLPTGEVRIFKGGKIGQLGLGYYLLQEEILASGHRRTYSYDDQNRLIHIEAKNPAGAKTYSWVHFDLYKTDVPYHFGMRTSDGKSFDYQAVPFEKEFDYLSCVYSANRVKEDMQFTPSRKGIGMRLESFTLNNQMQVKVSYFGAPDAKTDRKWHDSPKNVPSWADRVKTLQAPLGKSGEMINIAEFAYYPNYTDVRDSQNILTRFHHDGKRLSRIDYFDEKDALCSSVVFIWQDFYLKAKALLNSDGLALHSKTFDYDPYGNVKKEVFYGNFSGLATGPYVLNPDGSLSGAESFTKTYSYYPNTHLTEREEDETGFCTMYTYLPGTDLLSGKFTYFGGQILKREFKLYNEDHLLITEIVDDGNALDCADLSGVTLRQITRCQIDEISGLPSCKSVYGFDREKGAEVLLKRSFYRYENGRIVEERVSDSNGSPRYAISLSYNEHGKCVLQSDPLGQINRYVYDDQDRLVESQEVGERRKIYTYNVSGSAVSLKQVDEQGGESVTFSEYDSKGRLIKSIDEKGHTLLQTFDAFGRCLKSYLPQVPSEGGQLVSPTLSFSYDTVGNVTQSIGPRGETKQTQYTIYRKPCLEVEADGSCLRHIYNKSGNIEKTTYPDGSYAEFTYDPLQRLSKKAVFEANGHPLSQETWEYSAYHLLSYTDARGLTTFYTYDLFGRKISEEALGRKRTFLYDALGFLEKMSDGAVTFVQIHDVAGRVVEQWEETSGCLENFMRFYYGPDGRKEKAIRQTSVGKAEDRFVFDGQGRLIRHIDPLGATAETIYDDNYINQFGQRVLQKIERDPLGNAAIETFDALGRLVEKIHEDPRGKRVAHENFTYDESGNKVAWISKAFGRQ